MKTAIEQNAEKPAHSKEGQDMNAMLDRIKETRRKCGNGVKMLPVVRYERNLWFFDERLRQLRNVRNPHDFINLDDFELKYFRTKVV